MTGPAKLAVLALLALQAGCDRELPRPSGGLCISVLSDEPEDELELRELRLLSFEGHEDALLFSWTARLPDPVPEYTGVTRMPRAFSVPWHRVYTETLDLPDGPAFGPCDIPWHDAEPVAHCLVDGIDVEAEVAVTRQYSHCGQIMIQGDHQ